MAGHIHECSPGAAGEQDPLDYAAPSDADLVQRYADAGIDDFADLDDAPDRHRCAWCDSELLVDGFVSAVGLLCEVCEDDLYSTDDDWSVRRMPDREAPR